jgi:23S rRNA (uridine2552-2'-O)-methyltransferase
VAKRPSSQRWLQRQHKDPYVERAAREGWRSRATFKLQQIQQKEHVLRRGMVCLDLGASPGGWSQYAAGIIGPGGRLVALDLLPMAPIAGATFIQADFGLEATRRQLVELLGERGVDLVMSDLAPNISGNRAVDQACSMAFAEDALALASEILRPGGDFLVKLFQGEGFEAYVRGVRLAFSRVRLIKPAASRPESRENYLLARKYRMV